MFVTKVAQSSLFHVAPSDILAQKNIRRSGRPYNSFQYVSSIIFMSGRIWGSQSAQNLHESQSGLGNGQTHHPRTDLYLYLPPLPKFYAKNYQ